MDDSLLVPPHSSPRQHGAKGKSQELAASRPPAMRRQPSQKSMIQDASVLSPDAISGCRDHRCANAALRLDRDGKSGPRRSPMTKKLGSRGSISDSGYQKWMGPVPHPWVSPRPAFGWVISPTLPSGKFCPDSSILLHPRVLSSPLSVTLSPSIYLLGLEVVQLVLRNFKSWTKRGTRRSRIRRGVLTDRAKTLPLQQMSMPLLQFIKLKIVVRSRIRRMATCSPLGMTALLLRPMEDTVGSVRPVLRQSMPIHGVSILVTECSSPIISPTIHSPVPRL